MQYIMKKPDLKLHLNKRKLYACGMAISNQAAMKKIKVTIKSNVNNRNLLVDNEENFLIKNLKESKAL